MKEAKELKQDFYISEEDLDLRAENIIKASKQDNKDGVIFIFEQISLPFDGENYKRQLFHKIFNLAGINNEWFDDIGFVIFSENRTKKTVVSHMDLINKFNKGFRDNKVYEIKDDKLIGALDNTFTNAVVINHILNYQNKDTTYLFTLDEETKQHAIRDYMVQYGIEQFIINLDVTNDGLKNNMSIEYDEPSWEICRQIEKNLDSPYFTTERVGDDLDAVLKVKGYGFSYCLPTNKLIHSYNNYTMIDKIEPYMKGLDYLVEDMCLNSYQQNIHYVGIDEAITYNSLEKLSKKDVRKVFKVEKKVFEYDDEEIEYPFVKGKSSKTNSDIYDLIVDIAIDNSISKDAIKSFVSIVRKTGGVFGYKEFITGFGQNLYYELDALELIKPSITNFFEFNTNVEKTKNFKIYSLLKEIPEINASRFFKYLYEEDIYLFTLNDMKKFSENNSILRASDAVTKLIQQKVIKSKSAALFEILS